MKDTSKLRARCVELLWLILCLSAIPSFPQGKTETRHSRGYMTTPAELRAVADKAAQGVEPYRSAVRQLLEFAGNPRWWPLGDIDGEQNCHGTHTPPYIGNGSPLIFAKAIAYRLTGEAGYAEAVRAHLLPLTHTYGFGGERYSGNGCVLNLSWYLPGFIMAADLIEDYPAWTAEDKHAFQMWLAREVYKKVSWASDARSNNWGAAGSATSAMIADYLAGSGIELTDRFGKAISPSAAFGLARQRQLDRMNGNAYMDNYLCHRAVGIRPDGGIPEELARGSSGCDGLWIRELDRSWHYPQTHLEATVLHAELLLRRGDRSLYDNMNAAGAGSIRKAILFLLDNPNDRRHSVPWFHSHKPTLELAYRYYRDPVIGRELGVGTRGRYIGGKSGQMLHFGTITHGFAENENPGLPPTVPPP